jgi:hypothetical protein
MNLFCFKNTEIYNLTSTNVIWITIRMNALYMIRGTNILNRFQLNIT